jgi:hypothetical protein
MATYTLPDNFCSRHPLIKLEKNIVLYGVKKIGRPLLKELQYNKVYST